MARKKKFSQAAYRKLILSICNHTPKARPKTARRRLSDDAMDKLARKKH